MDDIEIHVQMTPNPNAVKFIVNKPIKSEGKATFTKPEDAEEVRLASELFHLQGVRELHFFDNYITVTFNEGENSENLQEQICAVIKTRMPVHNPDFQIGPPVKKVVQHESPELQKIQEILDNTVRNYLQADGGDLEIVDYKDKSLTIRYQGACGTCPSSVYGTLNAIQSILQDEFDPDIVVDLEPM